MKAVGIIAEYNPFHNGHAWHIEQAKLLSGCDGAVAVMSGHFLQRGEPASFDKWERAKMAILGGVDLVVELPTVFAVRSAQYFAAGGVRLLASLGIVSHLCFGAENDNLEDLNRAASSVHLDLTSDFLKKNLKRGQTYAKAFSHSVGQITGINDKVLSSPNNILAIEYLRAINKYAPQILPLPVKRKAAGYHDTAIQGNIASATAVRKALEQAGILTGEIRKALPDTTSQIIESILDEGRGPVRFEHYAMALFYMLRSLSSEEMGEYAEISEGIHNKLASCAMQTGTVDELLTLLKSKRYTRTRLQRILIHVLLGTKKTDIERWSKEGPPYARVLAFNDCGRRLLKEISENSTTVLVNKTSHIFENRFANSCTNVDAIQKMLAVDIKASNVYALGMPNPKFRHGGWDLLRSPLYISSRQ